VLDSLGFAKKAQPKLKDPVVEYLNRSTWQRVRTRVPAGTDGRIIYGATRDAP
jgi:hypothetical protein